MQFHLPSPNIRKVVITARPWAPFISALAGVLAPALVSGQLFQNVAPQQGIDILVQSDLFGNGISFFDFDQDGWDDLTFCIRNDSLEFYRNDQGLFVRLPSFLHASGETKHVLWVDYDNDGDMDLTVTTWQGTYRLYRNNGNFSFTDISVEAGLAQNMENTYGASWADYDRDGDLDLYVCIYEHEGNQTNFPRFNHLYRNNGNGTFTDVSLAAGVSDGIQMSFQAVWLDYDEDGWPDLYVINDRWFSNSLYRNNGDGTFSDVTAISGTAVTGQDPMTASVADFDNDGDLDIYMTNTGWFDKVGMLLVNNGDGSFSELGVQYGVNIATWSWGATWVDVDNDTWQDLYVTTSMPNGPIMDNVFYYNNGGTSFTSSPTLFAGNHNARSFAAARGDVNNDGHYEVAVQNQAPYLPFLWMNQGSTNNHVKVTLRGTTSNRMAIGSWIRVYAGGERYTQYTHCGENYTSQNSQHHIFGLGQHFLVDSIQVQYPSGHVDTYYQVPAGSTLLLTEGETLGTDIVALGVTEFCEGSSVTLDAGDHTAYLWSTGHVERYLTVNAGDAYWVQVSNNFGVWGGSDTVTVVVHPTPQLEATTQNPDCDGAVNGSIALVALPGTGPGTTIWNTGAEGFIQEGLEAGVHTYAFEDLNGCTTGGSIELIAPPPIVLEATSTPSTAGSGGTVTISSFGGVPPHSFALNGVDCEAFIAGLPAGEYEVTVTDANGCMATVLVIVATSTSMQSSEWSALSIHPNPTDGLLYVTGLTPGTVAIVYDAYGREVLRDVLWPAVSLDIGRLPAGQYVLVLRTNVGPMARIRVNRL